MTARHIETLSHHDHPGEAPTGTHDRTGTDPLPRTNHSLTRSLTADEKTWLHQPDSCGRRAFTAARLAEITQLPDGMDALASLLITGAGEPPVTWLPDPAGPLGRRRASLATVTLDPPTRTARILDGTPADIGARTWRVLAATDRPCP
ncbi:hypothetical protein [Streptomyces sp. NPDC059009]|uniref:hypothetical protein n=1 Tax=Streptomyces sp. NPDC059009 TaxID=3346694 RepID=UPI00368F64D1